VLIGYMRRKKGDNDTLSVQRQALQDAGCQRLVEDLASEGRGDQPELRRLLEELSPGDVVVVSQLDGLGRSLQEVVRLLQRIGAAGAGFRSLAEAIDTTCQRRFNSPRIGRSNFPHSVVFSRDRSRGAGPCR